jgi:hypothetical protein
MVTIDPITLETEIVDRLTSLNTGVVRVAATPEDASELRTPRGDRILVAFRGFALEAPENRINPHAQITQPGEIHFTIVIQVKDLRSHQGAFPLIRQILDLLTGFSPSTGKPIYCTAADFVSNDENIWTWSMNFSAPTVYAKRPEFR